MVLELAGNRRQKYIYTTLSAHTQTHTLYTEKQRATAVTTGAQKHTGGAIQPVVVSRRHKSFTSSVVNWAFSECWPVCHCVRKRFVHSERRKKISGDYPRGENPQEASWSARVHFGIFRVKVPRWRGCCRGCVKKTQRSPGVPRGAAFIQQSALRTWRAQVIISFGTAKPLRDVYLTRLAV